MTAISIITGVYNVREYLPRFIQSLQEQTFKDFEVLFVDDASTDDSAAILEAAASGDKRFSLLRQAQNSGVGAARNAGIRAAQGETLCFADPDDLLPPESLEVRYAAFKKHKTLVRACHKEIAADGQLLKHEARPPLAEVCIPRQEAGRIGVAPFLCAHWTWLFPTNMLRRCNIFHGENMRTADDIFMLAKLFFHIPKLVWLPDVVYHWMKRPESLSTTHYTYAHYADYLNCVDVFYEEAQKNQAIGLGDRFCNEYLWAYLAHCIRQGLNGQSTEEDAHRLVSLAADICGRHKTFTRFPENAARTARHVGLSMLRHVFEDTNPLMIQRLLNGHNAALDRHAELRYGSIRQNGWLPAACDKYDSRQRLLRVRYLFCGEHPEERFTHAGRPLQPAFAKNRLEYQGKDFSVFERIVWLPVPPCEDGPLEVLLNGRKAASTRTPAAIRRASPPGESD
ncbi:MAG: glycosyltransferase family 2 protein, partial [Deltaproteobacteria bacterium]|nr:glycosyltransferase family 2 protein [Deltaproteobacteria bacterium]